VARDGERGGGTPGELLAKLGCQGRGGSRQRGGLVAWGAGLQAVAGREQGWRRPGCGGGCRGEELLVSRGQQGEMVDLVKVRQQGELRPGDEGRL